MAAADGGGTNGGQDAISATAGIADAEVRDVRRNVVRGADRGAEDRRHGGRPGTADCAAYGGRAAAVLRIDAPFDGLAERVDPGKLPAFLRARLAGHAGEPDRARERAHT